MNSEMEKSAGDSTTTVRDNKFPAGIPFIVGNEGAERFSYYGMRQILYIYLTALFIGFVAESTVDPDLLSQAKIQATQWTHLFMAGVYFFPLVGAVLADRLLGKYRVIFWVSLIYVAGHAALAIGGRFASLENLAGAEYAIIAGLVLIAIGSGGIKPCVSANVGDQFTAKNSHLVGKVFQIFYFIINFGSFFASILTPWFYKRFGPEVAFGIPGILMAIAAFVFWLGRKKFVKVPPSPGGKLGRIDFFASTFLIVPLLLGVFVLLEESEKVVHAVTDGESGALLAELGNIASHWWWAALVGIVALIVGFGLAHRRQQIKEDSGFLAVLFLSWRNRKNRQEGENFWGPAIRHYGEEAAAGPPAVLRIMVVFSMISVFWALFDQHSSTWVEQAKSMNLQLTVPAAIWSNWVIYAVPAAALFGAIVLFSWVANYTLPKILKIAVPGIILAWGLVVGVQQFNSGESMTLDLLPAQIAALNPLLVMIIIPLLNVLVYNPLEKAGRPLKPLHRMSIGMFMAGFAFVTVALIQTRIEAMGQGTVPVLWQLIPYTIITCAEVLVSITGLEFAYTQAPRAMKSTIMGFWLLCVTFGNVLVAFLAPLQSLSLTTFFWVFAGLMAVAAVVFTILASFYKGKSYLQS